MGLQLYFSQWASCDFATNRHLKAEGGMQRPHLHSAFCFLTSRSIRYQKHLCVLPLQLPDPKEYQRIEEVRAKDYILMIFFFTASVTAAVRSVTPNLEKIWTK